MDWYEVAAAAINSVFVLMAVQFLRSQGMPWLKENADWLIPIIAVFIGPLMVVLTNYLTMLLGYPIDLSPISGVFLGGSAVAIHQIGKQWKKAA